MRLQIVTSVLFFYIIRGYILLQTMVRAREGKSGTDDNSL